jgi:hypothetical protein
MTLSDLRRMCEEVWERVVESSSGSPERRT